MRYKSGHCAVSAFFALAAPFGCDPGGTGDESFADGTEDADDRDAQDVFVFVGGHGYSAEADDDGLWWIRTALEGDYDILLADRLSPKGRTDVRGKELWERIVRTCKENKKVHLLAHGRGGLDARWMIEVLGEDEPLVRSCVESLTTIGTPHWGMPLAPDETMTEAWIDQGLRHWVSYRTGVRYFAWAGLAWHVGGLWDTGKLDYDAFYDPEYDDLRHIGAVHCDGQMYDPSRYARGDSFSASSLLPYYPGWPGLQSQHDYLDHEALKRAQDRDPLFGGFKRDQVNDGLVEVASARLVPSWERKERGIVHNAEFLGCIPADHYDMVGGGPDSGRNSSIRSGYRPEDFYAYNIERILYLKSRGALKNPGGACRTCIASGGQKSCAGLCSSLGDSCKTCVTGGGGKACAAARCAADPFN